MTKEQKISIFKEVLEKFETEEIRLYCEDMIGLIPLTQMIPRHILVQIIH